MLLRKEVTITQTMESTKHTKRKEGRRISIKDLMMQSEKKKKKVHFGIVCSSKIIFSSRPENEQKVLDVATKFDEDKPGLGQFYCIPCSRYFADQTSLTNHTKEKKHKKR